MTQFALGLRGTCLAFVLGSLHCGRSFDAAHCPSSTDVRSTVQVRFRDPGQIALEAADGRVLVPAGTGATEADLRSGTLGQWVTAKYATRLAREATGALTVEWDGDLPMAAGRREVVVLPDGTFSGLPVPAVPVAANLGLAGAPTRQPNLELTMCVWLYRLRAGYVPQIE